MKVYVTAAIQTLTLILFCGCASSWTWNGAHQRSSLQSNSYGLPAPVTRRQIFHDFPSRPTGTFIVVGATNLLGSVEENTYLEKVRDALLTSNFQEAAAPDFTADFIVVFDHGEKEPLGVPVNGGFATLRVFYARLQFYDGAAMRRDHVKQRFDATCSLSGYNTERPQAIRTLIYELLKDFPGTSGTAEKY